MCKLGCAGATQRRRLARRFAEGSFTPPAQPPPCGTRFREREISFILQRPVECGLAILGLLSAYTHAPGGLAALRTRPRQVLTPEQSA